METCSIFDTVPYGFLFKSYYVVWKLNIITARKIPWGMFKSYYVVWKLFERGNRAHARFWFKSYYVVWKPTYKDNYALSENTV